MPECYGGERRTLETATGTAVWYHSGLPPVAIRWVLVRDPSGEREPQAFLCTDLNATPAEILGWFVQRWSMETTFATCSGKETPESSRREADRAAGFRANVTFGLGRLAAIGSRGAASNQLKRPRFPRPTVMS
jgi:hypothetical protein